jgi:RNA polymerase primary sigma factor
MQSALSIESEKRRDGAESNLLSLYLKDISKIPLLKREEERSLAREAARGNTAAKEKLIRANLRFVVNIAKQYQNRGLPLEDLISEGNIGLMHAIERFDVEKGYHFISYAVWWIRQGIQNALSEKSRLIRVPSNKASELARLENGGEPVRMERKTALLLEAVREPVSLDAPLHPESDGAPVIENVEDKRSRRQEDLAIESSLREDLNAALATLARKESEVIQSRFGLNDRKPLSLRELGSSYRLTKERIRQIEMRALRQLQNPARSKRLRAYL